MGVGPGVVGVGRMTWLGCAVAMCVVGGGRVCERERRGRVRWMGGRWCGWRGAEGVGQQGRRRAGAEREVGAVWEGVAQREQMVERIDEGGEQRYTGQEDMVMVR